MSKFPETALAGYGVTTRIFYLPSTIYGRLMRPGRRDMPRRTRNGYMGDITRMGGGSVERITQVIREMQAQASQQEAGQETE